jgi:hypothetical protein
MSAYAKAELEEALRALRSLTGKCEKAQLKLREGTPQYTLMKNRLKAFAIAESLITDALEESS